MFFVISGFLITRLIRDEVQAGSFSFANFYVRRARRLFPSLFFTLAASFAAASWLFSPQHLERFGGALLSALFSVSNFYLLEESGYFDIESDFKPLLHTWSLSVEEQFYLVWPVLLFWLISKRPNWSVPLLLFGAGIASFLLNYLYLKDPATMFYLAPFRVFEFAIGGIMVWGVERLPRPNALLELLVPLGLALILWPVFCL